MYTLNKKNKSMIDERVLLILTIIVTLAIIYCKCTEPIKSKFGMNTQNITEGWEPVDKSTKDPAWPRLLGEVYRVTEDHTTIVCFKGDAITKEPADCHFKTDSGKGNHTTDRLKVIRQNILLPGDTLKRGDIIANVTEKTYLKIEDNGDMQVYDSNSGDKKNDPIDNLGEGQYIEIDKDTGNIAVKNADGNIVRDLFDTNFGSVTDNIDKDVIQKIGSDKLKKIPVRVHFDGTALVLYGPDPRETLYKSDYPNEKDSRDKLSEKGYDIHNVVCKSSHSDSCKRDPSKGGCGDNISLGDHRIRATTHRWYFACPSEKRNRYRWED